MRRVVGYLMTATISALVSGAVVALFVRDRVDRDLERRYISDLFSEAYTAREIYAGRAGRLADHIRDSLPDRVLGIEKEFTERGGRDSAYRMVSDVYDVSKAEVPVAIRSTLSSIARRPYGVQQAPAPVTPSGR